MIRVGDNQVLNQVRVAWVRVLAVGGMLFLCFFDHLDTHLTHETVHALVVDLPALPIQLFSDPAVSIGGPFSRHSLDGLFQTLAFLLDPGRIVITAARVVQQLAGFLYRIGFFEHPDYFPFLFVFTCKMLEAFFSMSFSNVSRPTRRSSSAI